MFRCNICGSDQMKYGIVTQMFQIEGKPVIIEHFMQKYVFGAKKLFLIFQLLKRFV